MKVFNLSDKLAKNIVIVVSSAIVLLSIVCVLLDKGVIEESSSESPSTSISKQEMTEIISSTNQLLVSQNDLIEEMNNNVTGILGIAKGTLELAPSFKPTIKPGRREPGKTQPVRKDSLSIEQKIDISDSISISISVDGDTVRTNTSDTTSKKGCCCCNCCCNNCYKQNCR